MKRRCLAFNLMEIMVALAIFSISVVVISQSFMNGLIFKKRAETVDHWDVDFLPIRNYVSHLTDAQAVKSGGTLTTVSGETVDWKGTITATNIVGLFKLQLSLKNAKKSEKPLSQILYVFQPKWGDADEQKALFERKKQAFKEHSSENHLNPQQAFFNAPSEKK